jgi:eukaryotic-like serine/threonine-protein kinase
MMVEKTATHDSPPGAAGQGGFTPPRAFGEYALVRQLGQGGMGQVFLARDTLLERLVAIKFVLRFESASSRARFLNEARAVARLQHPNVVTVHRVGDVDGLPYIVSEYVRGEPLHLLPRPLPWRRVLSIALDLARGLAAAHRGGVLHRDLKPSNAVLGEGGVTKLLDFGLAKLVEGEVPGASKTSSSPPPTSSLLELATTASAPCEARAEAPPLTDDSALLGTPLYLAPERWCGEPASAASDLYSLGAMLFELLSGQPPHQAQNAAVLGMRIATHPAPPIASLVPDLEPRFGALVDGCLHRDPRQRHASAEALGAALEELAGPRRYRAAPEGNPYRGLFAFQPEHRGLFFGRDAEVSALLDRLRGGPAVIVTGDSGVGKSSLCRAGVLPAASEGALGDRHAWHVASIAPGARPFTALCDALAAARPDGLPSARSADELVERLRELARARQGMLIFIDQLEELVTSSEPDEARALDELMGRIASGAAPGLKLLATVRSDFLTRVAAFHGIAQILSRALYLIPPLGREGIHRAVVGPAKLKGVRFENEALVERLVRSVSSPASLPLLQFTLAELWTRRDRERAVIREEALEEMGGVAGALARHADSVIHALLPPQRPLARELLTRMVSADGTRTQRTAQELAASSAERREVLEALIRGRIITADEADGELTYQLVHEALLSGWQTLRDWLDDSSAARLRAERLRAAAAEWQRLDRPRELLWAGPQLQDVAELDGAPRDQVTRDFWAASRRAARTRRLRRHAIVGLLVAAMGLTYGGVDLYAKRATEAQVSERLGLADTMVGEARADGDMLEELRARAIARYGDGEFDEGETLWREARELAAKIDRRYIDASSHVGDALTLSPTHAEARAMLADILYERVLLAEREHRQGTQEELHARLRAVDDDGLRRARLARPGRLVVQAAPAEAKLSLERYDRREDGRRVPTSIREPTVGPLDAELPAGSYRLLASAPGRADVRYPLTLRRGETFELEIQLPDAREVPEGFSYIPPGRFLAGSAADDELRHVFYEAPPLHQRSTGAYSIARHATTFADWIEYLEDLPPTERRARMPRPGNWGMVELVRHGPFDYELSFSPGTTTYRVRAGELVHYEARRARARQDWLAFPVSGISFDDAVAYAQWLDQSGRVPGARLCHEMEWERAARGADDRRYPHADNLAPDDANTMATYAADATGPSEVGSHPASVSPFGAYDMVGNVFEFTHGLVEDTAVVRGGAFDFDALVNQTMNRHLAEPGFLGLYVGVRMCASAPRRP